MDNKETIQKVIDAFDKSDVDAILNHVTDDMEWRMLGDQTISGKEAMRKFLANSEMKVISSSKDHIIVEGDQAVVDGDVQCTGKNGEVLDMYYCDIYELENSKVKKMITYAVNKKKKQQS